eukprot:371699-Pelagomonas_calceolata.AAC.2
MKYHFNKFGWPASTLGPVPVSEATKNALVDELQVHAHTLDDNPQPMHAYILGLCTYNAQTSQPQDPIPRPKAQECASTLSLGRSLEYAQDKKTEHYKSIVEQAAEARPGVLKLMDECLDHPDVAVCICSAATKEGFIKPLACQTFLSTMWHAHT